MALNWSNAVGGGVAGAGSGATAGAPGGPWGVGIGAGLGGLGGFFSGLFSGNQQDEQFGNQSNYSPEVQEQLNQQIMQLLSGLQNGQFDFGPIRDQAVANFNEQTVPSIFERLTSMGAGGGRSSGGLQILSGAGAGLNRDLAAMESQHGMKQLDLLQNLLSLGKGNPYHQDRQPGMFESFGPAAIQGLGSAAGGYLQGPGGQDIANMVRKNWGMGKSSGGQGAQGTTGTPAIGAPNNPIGMAPQQPMFAAPQQQNYQSMIRQAQGLPYHMGYQG